MVQHSSNAMLVVSVRATVYYEMSQRKYPKIRAGQRFPGANWSCDIRHPDSSSLVWASVNSRRQPGGRTAPRWPWSPGCASSGSASACSAPTARSSAGPPTTASTSRSAEECHALLCHHWCPLPPNQQFTNWETFDCSYQESL